MNLVDPNALRSRILPAEPEEPAPAPVEYESPLRRPGSGSESARALRQGVQNIKASGYALRGLVRAPFDEEGSRRDIQRSADIQARAAAQGPKIQAISDVSGIGSAFAYARNLGLSQLPNVAAIVGTSILTGGLAGLAAGGARAAATSAASGLARQGLARTAAGTAARAAPTAFETGAKVGAVAAGTGMQTGSIAPRVVLDDKSDMSYGARAGAAAVGSLATGAMELVPVMRLFGRYGMKKAGAELAEAAVKGGLPARVAKAAAAQAGAEGGTELAQSIGERLTHRFVNENIGLLSPEALEEYANAAVAGAVVGGVLGGPAGLRGGQPGPKPPPGAPKAKRLPPGTRMDPPPDADTLEGELARDMQKPVAGTIKMFSAPEVAANAKARVVGGADPWAAALAAMTTPAGEPVNEGMLATFPAVRKLLTGETLDEAEAPLAQAFYDSIQNNAIKHEFRRTIARVRQGREGVVDTPNDQLSPSMRAIAPIADEGTVDDVRANMRGPARVGDVADAAGVEAEGPAGKSPLHSIRGSTRVDPLTGETLPPTVSDVRKQMGEDPILSPDFVRNNVYNFSDGDPERIPVTARKSVIAANVKGSDGRTKRVMVNLRAVVDKMLGSELARSDADTDPRTYERAVLAAMSELISNGYDINPLSLAPGITISSRDGNVVKLSPAVAARVREQLMPVRYDGDAGPAETAGEKIERQHLADVSKRADKRRNAAIKDFEVINNELGDRRTEYSDTTTAGDVAIVAARENKEGPRRIDEVEVDHEVKTSGKVNDQFDRYDIPTIRTKLRELSTEYRKAKSVAAAKSKKPGPRKVALGDLKAARAAAHADSASRDAAMSKVAKIRKQMRKYGARLNKLQQERTHTLIAKLEAIRKERNDPKTSPERRAELLPKLREVKAEIERGDKSFVPGNERAPAAGNFKGGMTEFERSKVVAAELAKAEAPRKAAEAKKVKAKAAARKGAYTKRNAKRIAALPEHAEDKTKVKLSGAGPYTAKDQIKSDKANKFIGRGSPASSTNRYAKDWGDKANTGQYTQSDTVFVSAEGARAARVPHDNVELDKAIKAGATIVTDNAANRVRDYNVGERAVAEQLRANMYAEVSPGVWKPSAARSESKLAAKEERNRKESAFRKMLRENKLKTHEGAARLRDEAGEKAKAVAADLAKRGEEAAKAEREKIAANNARKAAEKAADADQIEGDKSAPKPPNLAPLQAIVDTITKLLNVDPIKLVFDPSKSNRYYPGTKTISINGSRRGGALIQTIYHEIGHHVARTKFKSASVETKQAIIADYKAWRKSQRGVKDNNAIRASRAPHMIAKLARQMVGGKNTPKGRVYALKAHEYLADQLARALVADKKTGQTLVEKFFGALARALKAAYNSFAPKYAPAPSVQQWVNQLMAAQPTQAAPTPQAASLVSMLDADTRGILEKELTRRSVVNQLRASGFDIDTYGTKLENVIEAAAALYNAGKLKLGDDTRPLRDFFERRAWKILGFTSSADYAKRALEAFKNGAMTKAGYSVRADYAKTTYQKATLRALNFARGPLTKHASAFLVDIGNRIRSLNIPAARELVAQFNLRPGEAGDQDMRKARVAKGGEYSNRLSDIVSGMKEPEIEALQKALTTHTPPTDPALLKAYDEIKTLLEVDMYKYLVDSGVEIPKRPDFYPVRMDFEAVAKDAVEYKGLMAEIIGVSPAATAEVRRRLRAPEDATVEEMAQMMFTNAVYNPEGGAHEYTAEDSTRPYFESAKGQLSSFVFKHGTQEQKDKFAKFVDPSLQRTMGTYIRQAVRRAEFAKRFGDDGHKLTSLFNKAKEQGATDVDLALMRDYVNVALGTHERRLNPFIHRLLKFGDSLTGFDWANTDPEKIHGYMAVVSTYNNIRLLGLAALSSFIDPVGVYSRTGNFRDTFKAYRKALSAMWLDDPDGLAHAAYAMGVIDRDTMNEAIAHMYGGAGEIGSRAHKVNSWLFQYNGLDHITRYTRIAALAAGHLFLLRHANPETSNQHSERFLRDLGISASDIHADQNNPNRVEINDKTQAALLRFVEEAALRPAGEVKPSWHSDPNFQLVSQYRGYLYAFYNTIVKRMINEAKHHNFAPLAVPALAYIGVSAFAEMLREVIQTLGEGDPRREKWGVSEYAAKGFDRSGLISPRASVLMGVKSDTEMGSSPLNSLIGPTGQQVANIIDTVQGDRRLSTTFVDATPLSSVHEDWWD